MSYVFYMILFSVFVLMLQHMTAFRFLFTQFVCTICSDSVREKTLVVDDGWH